jgi:dUTPase
MLVYIKKNPNIDIPKRAHETDTGLDIYAISDPIIHGVRDDYYIDDYKSISYIEYKTGIYINLLHDSQVYVNIRPRSSLRKYNLSLCNSVGLCDNGYTGEYIVSFNYIFQPEDLQINTNGVLSAQINYDKIYKKGDKIAQLEFVRGNEPINFIPVEDDLFNNMEGNSFRKSSGHGSTN